MDTSLYHTDTKIQNAKRRFINAHNRTIQATGKKRIRRKELRFSDSEFTVLDELATLHNRQLAVYLRELIYSAITDIPALPEGCEETIQSLSKSIMKSANNVNQLVRYVHRSKSVSVEDIEHIYHRISELETEVRHTLSALITSSRKQHGSN